MMFTVFCFIYFIIVSIFFWITAAEFLLWFDGLKRDADLLKVVIQHRASNFAFKFISFDVCNFMKVEAQLEVKRAADLAARYDSK